MGLEWESGGLPDEILDKYMIYSTALKQDLLYVTSLDENYSSIVSILKCDFSALHNLIKLACPILKDQVPDTALLIYKEAKCINHHVKQVHEYVLQSKLFGISMLEWQQWQVLIRGLLMTIRTILDTSAISEISQPGFEKDKKFSF